MSEEVRPGYKRTEVGVIPEDWETSRVGDVCGCIVPGRNKPKFFNGDIPWITTPDLIDGKPVTTSRLDLFISRSEAKMVGSKVVPPGSVLMSCAGELGIVALTQNEIVVNQQLHVFLPTDRINAKFLLNVLYYQKNKIAGLGTKTAVPYLNKTSCNSILVPLPPLPEQRAIAEALSDVDALLGALNRLIAKKRDLKQAAMQQLLAGQTRLPGFHGEWEVKRLGDVGVFTKGSGIKKDEVILDGLPCVRYGEIYTHHNDNVRTFNSFITSETAQKSQRIQKGDLLFAGSGETAEEIGKCVAYLWEQEAYAGGDIVILRPNAQSSEYLGYLLNQSSVAVQKKRMGQGDAVVHISARNLGRVDLHCPPLPEQTAIAAVLSDMDAELITLEQRRNKTRALKQGMMQELLTGKTRLLPPGACHA